MKKFKSSQDLQITKNLPFSYYSTNLYLDFAAYTFDRNDESLIVWQDLLYPNEFPCIFMPSKKENWIHSSIAFATNENVEEIQKENIEILLSKPTGSEFFYKTSDFTNLKGDFKNRVNKFISNYNYTLTSNCDDEEINDFYNFWKNQREHVNFTITEDEDFFNYCMNNLDKYNIKQVYVRSDNKIIGLAWGVSFQDTNNWVGLHLKVDYSYVGLSRFLFHERAKLFKDCNEFSLGTEAHDEGLKNYKESLGPAYKKEYYFVLTGNKII